MNNINIISKFKTKKNSDIPENCLSIEEITNFILDDNVDSKIALHISKCTKCIEIIKNINIIENKSSNYEYINKTESLNNEYFKYSKLIASILPFFFLGLFYFNNNNNNYQINNKTNKNTLTLSEYNLIVNDFNKNLDYKCENIFNENKNVIIFKKQNINLDNEFEIINYFNEIDNIDDIYII